MSANQIVDKAMIFLSNLQKETVQEYSIEIKENDSSFKIDQG